MSFEDVLNDWVVNYNHLGPRWSASDLLALLVRFLDLTPGGHGGTPDRFRLFLDEQALQRMRSCAAQDP